MWTRLVAGVGLVVAFIGLSSMADPAKDPVKKPDTPPAAKTIKVEKGPIKIDVTLKGTATTAEMAELQLHPEAWDPVKMGGPMIVDKAVEHGTTVKKGDTVVWMDLTQIEQTIRDMDTERKLAMLSIQLAEEEYPLLEKATPLDLDYLTRSHKMAEEDLKRYLDSERADAEKNAEVTVKNTSNYLEYAKEELRQLEKMYKAKDMTEETEEIILKRQRNQVEQVKHYLKVAETQRDKLIQVELPRREKGLQDNLVKSTLLLDKAKSSMPLNLKQKQQALEKAKYDREKADQRLAKLKRDRDGMTVRAPIDGIVYYGKFVHGNWQSAAAMGSKLNKGGMLQPHEIFITIIKPRPLHILATIEEKDLHQVQTGQKCKVVPTAYPDLKFAGKVKDISPVPVKPGIYEAKIGLDDDAKSLVPGMSVSAKIVSYQKEDALTVLAAAVFTEELDEDKHYVYASKDGKFEKRSVTVGKTTGGKTEILKGLKEGDEISATKPEDKKEEKKEEKKDDKKEEAKIKIEELKEGKGAAVKTGDKVEVHYTGWLAANNKEFDSSVGKDPLKVESVGEGLIKGFSQGLEGMKLGGKRKVHIPAELGYGAKGAGKLIPPNSDLIFEIEVVKHEPKEKE